jgi:hypothetical protein
MTSEAPERIWAQDADPKECDYIGGGWWDDALDGTQCPHTIEYIRADHALALVAEAYEGAAEIYEVTFDSLARLIRALTPADALAAREARDRKVREEALREAAATITEDGSRNTVYQKSRNDAALKILALIEGETE